MLKHLTVAVPLVVLIGTAALAAETIPGSAMNAPAPLVGADAFGDWQQSKPGVQRLIRPQDIPAPFATKSASNAPGVVERPANAMPKVPAGFQVSLVADDFEQPRVIRTAPNGDIFVADSGANEIRVLRMQEGSAKPSENSVFASGLDQPYGIAFYPPGPNPEWVYVANTGNVVRFPYKSGDLKASGAAETIVPSLPTGYHWTRDLAFSPDGSKLFVSVGSGSNIAEDVKALPEGGIQKFAAEHAPGAMWGEEENRGTVLAFNPDGSGMQVYATGLRNCSGLTVQPSTGSLWCVVNERDELGDNTPPDYATRVTEGAFYGWPWYYIGNNPDPRAPLAGQRPDLADKVTVPDVLFQAHSAPLNLTFYEGSAFPADYKGSAFVALHGSWNRGNRTGYEVVRMLFDGDKPTGVYEDFMTGFITPDGGVWGRPVGLTVAADGSLLVTDDGSGSIWRVRHDAGPS